MYENTSMTVSRSVPPRPPMRPAHGVREVKLSPHQLRGARTATEDMFVIAHLGIPRVDPRTWSLSIDGMINQARTFTLEELKALPKKAVEAVHQCCGNPMEPDIPTRRVTNVRWAGVDLSALLSELEVNTEARFLWSYGLDGGEFAGMRCDWFVKDLPLQRLAVGGVLLAYEVNGEPIPAEHGFPLRLVVPGYYGTNSVKWLWRLRLAAERAHGLFTTTLYNDVVDQRAAGYPARRPVWSIAPESLIVTPAPEAVITVGETIEISGWAWSCREVAEVDVSLDDGATYSRAALEPARGWAWRRFSLPWRPSRRGETMIRARASDISGVRQPPDGARNAAHAVKVLVK